MRATGSSEHVEALEPLPAGDDEEAVSAALGALSVANARRGWAATADVLNTRPLAELLAR